jgi:hypothetical protein
MPANSSISAEEMSFEQLAGKLNLQASDRWVDVLLTARALICGFVRQ